MTVAQRVAANTTALIAGRILGVLVSLVTLRITTGYLGVDEFGELAIIFAVGGLLVTVSDLGISTTLARELVKTPEATDALAGSLLRFRILSSLGLAAVTLAFLPALPYSFQTKIGLALYLVGAFAFSVATFPRAFFQAHLQLYFEAAVGFGSKILTLGAVALVAWLDLGFYALVGGFVVVAFIELAGMFSLLRRYWRPTLRWERGRGRRLVRDSLAVGLVSTVGILHFRADAILMSLLTPAADVGIYAIAYQFVAQAAVFPGMFVATVFPVLTRLVHEGAGRADETINRSFQALALGAATLALGIFTLAEPVISIIAGPGFEDALEPSRILALSLPFLFCTFWFSSVCIAVSRLRPLVWIGLAALSLNVALNLVLIPRYSYTGAAVATVVSEAASLAGTFWIARRTVLFRFDAGYVPRLGVAAAAATLAGVVLLERSAVAAFVVAELVLFALAYVLGAFSPGDIRALARRDGGSAEA